MQVYKDELYHHGIKGMKWGVRRYQNYDGTYTQRGLKRYREAENRYNNAKSAYDVNKSAVNKASVREAKKALNKSYDYLKNDKMADQGKKYYQKGQTITDNSIKTRYQQVAIVGGATLVAKALASTGHMKAAGFVATSGSAAATGLEIYNHYKNQRLRAYYAHSDRKENSSVGNTSVARVRNDNTTAKSTSSSNTPKTYSKKDYVAAHNRASDKINDSSNHILSDFNKKWEGKYGTPEYEDAFMNLFNQMIEDELK